jgi:hypothetical protein
MQPQALPVAPSTPRCAHPVLSRPPPLWAHLTCEQQRQLVQIVAELVHRRWQAHRREEGTADE